LCVAFSFIVCILPVSIIKASESSHFTKGDALAAFTKQIQQAARGNTQPASSQVTSGSTATSKSDASTIGGKDNESTKMEVDDIVSRQESVASVERSTGNSNADDAVDMEDLFGES
jgi:hypothetical protein